MAALLTVISLRFRSSTFSQVQYTYHYRVGRATIFCDNEKATTQHCVMASVTLKKKITFKAVDVKMKLSQGK